MGAPFKFKCGCGKSLAADASLAGKRAKCPNCGKVLQIPAPPQPKSSDDELEMLPLVDSPVKPKPAAPSPPRQNPSAPTAGQPARRPNSAPQSQAAVSPAAPAGGNSIWDEVDEDDYRLQAAAVATSTPCPKCGTSMSSQAVLCIACGYNKQTGVSATTQLAPRPSKKSGSSWFSRKRREKSPEEQSWRLPIGLLVAGIALLIWGIKEKTLADASSQQPETISLQQLIARGADGNPNIVLTDYQICDGCVAEGRRAASGEIVDWKKVWIPIVKYGDNPFTTNPQALIYSTRVKKIEECLPVLQHTQLRGMVTNRITSLGSKEQNLLRGSYPSINFDRCLIFHEGREPKSSDTILLILLGGGGLILAGGLLIAKNYI